MDIIHWILTLGNDLIFVTADQSKKILTVINASENEKLSSTGIFGLEDI